jgi:hypothetical protein
MKNLAKTIDKILKVEPDLRGDLLPIRRKFNRWPQKVMDYWKELLSILNSSQILSEDQKNKIRSILVNPTNRKKLRYTFKQVGPGDRIIGAVPEHIADKLKSHDRRRIEVAKRTVEAEVTNDSEAYAQLMRKNAHLDIEQAKIWISVKDHFNLWPIQEGNLHIKKNGEVLVVTSLSDNGGGSGNTFLMHTPMGTVKMDGEALSNWFKTMGMQPPPGMFPDSEKDSDDDED